MILNPDNIDTEIIGADLSQVVDRIIRQYSDFPTAFQKEAIQNSWDEREDRSTGKGWAIKFSTFKEDSSTHLIIEDFVTKGMNLERWDAFLSLWKPKKELGDAGGQGQGKFVLMGASKVHTLIVESSSKELPYRCKLLRNEKKSKDGVDYSISDFVENVKPLDHLGTKIWVYDVDQNFLRFINSEQFVESVQESWWQILGGRFEANIELFGKKVILNEPPQILEEKIFLENHAIDGYGRIKRLVLSFYEKPLPDIFQGVRIQRANMMITKIPFEVYEKEYKGRFSGHLEFDSESSDNLEIRLKKIEKTDHCGFLHESPWKEIKVLVKNEAENFVSKIVPDKSEKKAINIKNISQIIQKANQIINDYCPEVLGSGTVMPEIIRKAKLPLRISSLSVNKREVRFGDFVQSVCKIINEFPSNKKIILIVDLKRMGTKISEERYKLKIKSGEQKVVRLSRLDLDKERFPKGKYVLRATISDGLHDIETKSTSFYLEVSREPVKRGFIKKIEFSQQDTPTRYSVNGPGVIKINLSHKDFLNIYEYFKMQPNIQNKQVGFYIIKICLDEALNELLRVKIKGESSDIVDQIEGINELKGNMYYDIYN